MFKHRKIRNFNPAFNKKETCNTGQECQKTDSNEHKEPMNTTVIGIWENFTQTTGFHAVNKITFNTRDSRGITRSICWVIVWLICAIYLTYTVVTELKSYYSYPTISNTVVKFHDRLDFPAVTVCNLSPRKKSAFSKDAKTKNLYMQTSGMFPYSKPINWSDLFYKENGYFEKQTMENVYKQAKDQGDFLYMAAFDSEFYCGDKDDCGSDVSNLFQPVLTDLGLCFRANGNGTMNTTMYGALLNLQLYINVMKYEDYFSHSLSSGVKVAVHDHRQEPIMMNEGVVVRPSSEAFIEIHKKEYKFLPPPYTAFGNQTCLDDKTYSYSKCHKACLNKIITEKCGCGDFLSKENGPFCSYFDYLTCSSPTYWLLMVGKIKKTCNCPPSCHITTYDYACSSGDFPSGFIGDQFRAVYGFTNWLVIRDNLCLIRIYFKQLTTVLTEQVPKYPNAGAIFANIGGQLGLFLGASILTVTELLEFVVLLMYTLIQRFVYRSDKTHRIQQTTQKKDISMLAISEMN